MLRGGTPTAYDRVLATRFGIAAIDAVHDGAFGTMVALHGERIERVPIGDAVARAEDRRSRAARGGRGVLRVSRHSTICVGLLDLELLEVNLFRGESLDPDRVRLYGGEVLAQALDGRGSHRRRASGAVHSMHAYFLKLGDPKVPVVYEVDRIRDGRSFTTRRGRRHPARHRHLQHGGVVPGRRDRVPTTTTTCPRSPEPESLSSIWRPSAATTSSSRSTAEGSPHVVDAVRHAPRRAFTPPGGVRGEPVRDPDQDTWFRTRGPLPDDPLLHTCIVAYASDLTLLGTATLPHPMTDEHPGYMVASLDHVMWFHRPFRADDWLLYHTHSPSAAAGRGLRDRTGVLRRRHAGGERGAGGPRAAGAPSVIAAA